MGVNKKYLTITAAVLSACLISFYAYWLMYGVKVLVHPVAPTVSVQDVSWEILLAKAELNLHYMGYGKIDIEYIEVNGTRADSYPQNLTMEDDDYAIIKVYFPYDYDSAYEFRIFTTWRGQTFNYTSVQTSRLQ